MLLKILVELKKQFLKLIFPSVWLLLISHYLRKSLANLVTLQ